MGKNRAMTPPPRWRANVASAAAPPPSPPDRSGSSVSTAAKALELASSPLLLLLLLLLPPPSQAGAAAFHHQKQHRPPRRVVGVGVNDYRRVVDERWWGSVSFRSSPSPQPPHPPRREWNRLPSSLQVHSGGRRPAGFASPSLPRVAGKCSIIDNWREAPLASSGQREEVLSYRFSPPGGPPRSHHVSLGATRGDDRDGGGAAARDDGNVGAARGGEASTAPAPNPSPLRTLYPPSRPIRNGTIRVDQTHTLYYEEYGRGGHHPSSTGDPARPTPTALFLHGGPGAGCYPNHARFFDPSYYRIFLLDQRGAGRSTPRGETTNNTLSNLVEDCEILRRDVAGVDSWTVVLGGSWGVTLAVAYATVHPDRVGALVLRGVCLMRPREVDWLFGGGGGVGSLSSAADLNPGGWSNFSALADQLVVVGDNDDGGEEESGGGDDPCDDDAGADRDVLHAYYDALLGDDREIRLHAAAMWFRWEMSMMACQGEQYADMDRLLSRIGVAERREMDGNETDKDGSSPVLVWDGSSWALRDSGGSPLLSMDSRRIPPSVAAGMASSLRRFAAPPPIDDDDASSGAQESPEPTVRESSSAPTTKKPAPRRRRRREWEGGANPTMGADAGGVGRNSSLPPSFVPAQSMLTCYYSVNSPLLLSTDEDCRGSDSDCSSSTTTTHSSSLLLDGRRMELVRRRMVPCVAIQGGCDVICPPDTALDLHAVWPEMEVRIPLFSGHSMYDPSIASEIVSATDRVRDGGLV